MIYFIERTQGPLTESIADCHINGKIYDIVVSPRDTSLEGISEHVVADDHLGMVFEKTDPREQAQIKEFIESRWGPMNELLLG